MSTEKMSGRESVLDALSGDQDLEELAAREGAVIGAPVATEEPTPVVTAQEPAKAEAEAAPVIATTVPAHEDEVVDDDEVATPVSIPGIDPAPGEGQPAGDEIPPPAPWSSDADSDPEAATSESSDEGGSATSVPPGTVVYAGRLQRFETIEEFRGKSKTVHQSRPMQSGSPRVVGRESLTFSNMSAQDLARLVASYTDEEADQSDFSRAWHAIGANALGAGMDTDEVQVAALAREGAVFRQGYQNNDRIALLRVRRPSSASTANEGTQAVLRVLDAFDMTAQADIFLPHSGYWVKLARPSDSAISAAMDRIEDDAMIAAQETYGRSFSTRRSLVKSSLRDFIHSHVLTVSVDTQGKSVSEYLTETLSTQDDDMTLWGLALMIWQDGWQYYRQVAGDGENPHEIIEQVLDVRGLMYIDNSRFTPEQLNYITATQGKIATPAQREAYLNGFKTPTQTTIDPKAKGKQLRHPTRFNLRTPTNHEMIVIGENWIREINKAWEESLATTDSRKQRRAFLAKSLNASRMRAYEPWVFSIELGEDDNVTTITDRATIIEVLSKLSNDDVLFQILEQGVVEHLKATNLYVTGVPALDKRFGEETFPDNPYLIPLDVLMSFFIMLKGEVEVIAMR